MDIRIEEEFVYWGDHPLNYVGFFSPITHAREVMGRIVVTCKYGEYSIENPNDLDNRLINTLEGVDWYTLSEVAKYGLGIKHWIIK